MTVHRTAIGEQRSILGVDNFDFRWIVLTAGTTAAALIALGKAIGRKDEAKDVADLRQGRAKCQWHFRSRFIGHGLRISAALVTMIFLGGTDTSQAIDREQLIEHNRHIEQLIRQKSVREVLTAPARASPRETVAKELETLQRRYRTLEENVLRLQMTVSQRLDDAPSVSTLSNAMPSPHAGPTGDCRGQSLVAGTLLSNLARILINCRRTLGHWPLIEADNVVVDFRIATPPALPVPGGLDQLFAWMRDTYGIVPASPDSRPGDVIRFVERAVLTPVAAPTVVQAAPSIQPPRPKTRTGTVKYRFDEAERAK